MKQIGVEVVNFKQKTKWKMLKLTLKYRDKVYNFEDLSIDQIDDDSSFVEIANACLPSL